MKQTLIILTLLFTTFQAIAQTESESEPARKQFTYTTTIGTGIPMNNPASTPFTWQVQGYYNISSRFSAGAGTGLSFYEKMLIPVFADVKFTLTKPKKFTPYLEYAAGYAFATTKKTNGGFYMYPSVGVQYALPKQFKLQLAIGYEIQHLERLKSHTDNYFTKEYQEKLNHQTLAIRAGLIF